MDNDITLLDISRVVVLFFVIATQRKEGLWQGQSIPVHSLNRRFTFFFLFINLCTDMPLCKTSKRLLTVELPSERAHFTAPLIRLLKRVGYRLCTTNPATVKKSTESLSRASKLFCRKLIDYRHFSLTHKTSSAQPIQRRLDYEHLNNNQKILYRL